MLCGAVISYKERSAFPEDEENFTGGVVRTLPSLNALRVFESAARRGSFKLAAEELFITPTAVSHQIRQLEARMGVVLFRRDPRPIALTEAGRELFPAVRDALDRMAAGVASAQAIRSPRALVVTTTPAFASYWLIPRLPRAQQAMEPGSIIVQATEMVVDLHAGHADVALRYAAAPSSELVCTELLRDRYVPVCRPSLLDGMGPSGKTPHSMAGLPLIHYDWKHNTSHAPTWEKWVAGACEAGERAERLPDPAKGLRFSEEIHAMEAALDGQGVALLSSAITARALEQGTLLRAHDFALTGLGLFAVYSAQSPKREMIAQFLQAVTA